MVPNVYGMSQFADGGLMSTKLYISSSNYLINMGDFKRSNFFLSNNRSKFLVRVFDHMPEDKKESLIEEVENYLKNLFINN